MTVCTAGPPGCDYATIQAALNAASNGDSIHVLTQPEHSEAGILIDKDVTIFGDGREDTFIQAAISPNTASDRVFSISTGAEVVIRDLTIRHGNPGISEDGGCIYVDGGELELIRARVLVCEAKFGAGIYNAGRLVLTDSSVRLNNAGLGGGGIYNAGFLSLKDSQVDGNVARSFGGGIINDLGNNAYLTGSSVDDNKVGDGTTQNLFGGGIYNLGKIDIRGSTISGNSLDGINYSEDGFGGGIYSDGEIDIQWTELQENSISGIVDQGRGGGAIFFAGSATISNSTFTSNSVTSLNGQGGGVAVVGGIVDISDVTLEGNSADFGGGLTLGFVSSVTVSDSTFKENTATRSGGGLQVYLSQGEGVKFANVTLSGNQANDNGGGIFVHATGVLNLANATITGNTADANADGSGHGGGIAVEISADNSGILTLRNSIIAGNLDLSPGTYSKAPDCDNTITSQGYNLIGNLGRALNGTHCMIEGDTSGNLIGNDPKLGSLQDNGGPTLTHALNQGSEAINAGNPNGCSTFNDAPLQKDQRGALREGRCDMGAYEFGGLLPSQYLPLILNP